MGWRFINRRWCSFGVSDLLLTHLLFLIEVIEDNDIVIAGRPEKSSIEVIEELSGDLLIMRSVREGVLLPL
jgi:hypothetical protein